jgi:hypothetical protein
MRLVLIIIMLPLFNTSRAQIRIYVENKDTANSSLYIELDNRVRIEGFSDEHKISVLGGRIIKNDKDIFYLRPDHDANSAFVRVTMKDKEELVAWKKFEVRSCEWPVTNWRSGSKTSIDSLTMHPFLSLISSADCNTKLNFHVLSFDAAIDHADSVIAFPSKRDQFSQEFVQHLRVNKDGSVITFDNIRAIGPDGSKFRFPGVVLYLK